MQLTPAPPVPTTIGHGSYMPLVAGPGPAPSPVPVEVRAGRVLMEGVSDVSRGFQELRATRDRTDLTLRLIAFLPTGDTFRAVELLANPTGTFEPLYVHQQLRDLRLAAGVDVHSVWDLGDYGWDASKAVLAGRP